MVETPEWQSAIERNKWNVSFLTGAEFGEFLSTEQERVAGVLEDLGLIS